MKVVSCSLNTSGGYMTQFRPSKLLSSGVGVASEAGSGLIGWGSQVEVLEAEAEAAVVVWLRSPLLASEVAEALVGVEAPAWLRAWAGIRIEARDWLLDSSWVVKLNKDGFSRPLGSLTLGSRSSSKKEWAQASSGVSRAVGVYSNSLEHNAMASGGVRGRNTCGHNSELY